MSSLTTRMSLYKPVSGENVNVVTDLNNNWDSLDLNMNFRSCTSVTRPSTVWDGLNIHETDTNRFYVWNATPASSGWYELYSSGGTISQINLSGATTGANTLTSKVSGDANPRLQTRADGRLEWGSGSATPDTFLRRTGVNALTTDGGFTVVGSAAISATTESTALTVAGGATVSKSLTVGGSASLGGAQGALGLKNITTAPTADPASGLLLYSNSGQLTSMNPQGLTIRLNGATQLSNSQNRNNFTSNVALGTLTIPGNDPIVGATYRIKAWGIASALTATTPTYTFILKINGVSGTALATAAVTTASGISNRPWMIDGYVTITTAGAAGACMGQMMYHGLLTTTTTISTTTPEFRLDGTATVGSQNFTTDTDFSLTITCSAANASNSVTMSGMIAERVA